MPLKHNLITTLHGLVTIYELTTGFNLINTGVVNCLIMYQNARKMHHSEAKSPKIFLPRPLPIGARPALPPKKKESPGSASDLAFHPLGVDKWVVSYNQMAAITVGGGAVWWTLTRQRQAWCVCSVKTVWSMPAWVLQMWASYDGAPRYTNLSTFYLFTTAIAPSCG